MLLLAAGCGGQPGEEGWPARAGASAPRPAVLLVTLVSTPADYSPPYA